MSYIRTSYYYPQDLFSFAFRCHYFKNITEIVDFYFSHPELKDFSICIDDSMGCYWSPEFYNGEDYRDHFHKLGFVIDW